MRRRPDRRSDLARRPVLEAVEARRLFSAFGADIRGTHMSVSATDPMPGQGEVTIHFTVKNNGGLFGNAGAFDIGFWGSNDSPLEPGMGGYGRVGGVRVPRLDVGRSFSGSLTIAAWQGDWADNEAYLFMEVDETSAQNSNHWPVAEGRDVVAYSSEGDLVRRPTVEDAVRATPTSLGSTRWGSIGDEAIGTRDLDVFDVELGAGQTYGVDLDDAGGGRLDSYVRVYDADWNVVAQNDDGRAEEEGASRDAYAQFRAGRSGTHHVVVSNAFNHHSDPRVLHGRSSSNDYRARGDYAVVVRALATPTVSLEVIDGSMREGGADDATVRVRRSGSPDAPLGVSWSLTGDADYVADYHGVGGSPGQFGVTIPAGQQYVDVTWTAFDEGRWEADEGVRMQVHGTAQYAAGAQGVATLSLRNAALDRPYVTERRAIFDDNGGPRLTFSFDDDVSASLDAMDFTLVDADTNAPVDRSAFTVSWNGAERTATIRFVGSAPADGNYRITLDAAGVTNGGGAAMTFDSRLEFFSLAGDLNRDRSVDFADLVILAQSYGRSGMTPATGNADYDPEGVVGFGDLVTLAQRYGRRVAEPPAWPTAAASADGPLRGRTFGAKAIDGRTLDADDGERRRSRVIG